MCVCLSTLDTPKKSSKTRREPLKISSARVAGNSPLPLQTFPKNHGAGCWGKMIANRIGISPTRTPRHPFLLGAVARPCAATLVSFRAWVDMAFSSHPSVRTAGIRSHRCCIKSDDTTHILLRLSVVGLRVIGTWHNPGLDMGIGCCPGCCR